MTEEEYRVNFLLDNLPVAVAMYPVSEQGEASKAYELGYPSERFMCMYVCMYIYIYIYIFMCVSSSSCFCLWVGKAYDIG
jgi:hypothetical protein